MTHFSPQAHRLLDGVLWILWLLPVACLVALVCAKGGTAARIAGVSFLALAEAAWLLWSVPYPGSWTVDAHAAPDDGREIRLPRPYTRWAGIEIRVHSDAFTAGPCSVHIRFTSGRAVELGPADVANGSKRIDCDEEGATVWLSSCPPLTLTAFEDPQAWKDFRVAWSLRQAARPWLAWGGALMFLGLAGHAF